MPVDLGARMGWIERNLVDAMGRQIEVRPWMINEIFKPIDGYKIWSRTPDGETPRVCERHRPLIGSIRPSRRHCWVPPHDGCDGLRGHKIIMILEHVTRQDGKSTGLAAWALSTLDLGRNTPMLYFAASESQTKRVFAEKFADPVFHNPELKERLQVGRLEISNPAQRTVLKCIPTSTKSIAAGSYRVLFVDEIREMDEELLVKAAVQVVSAKGLECPHGHHTEAMKDDPPEEGGPYPPCPACGAELEEWHGVVVLASSSGEDEGILFDMVELFREQPDRGVHFFSSVARLNPSKNTEAVDTLGRVFRKMPSTRAIAGRELDNEFARRGDEFLPPEAIKSITNAKLQNVDESIWPCVAFLDCSQTQDLTSLVVAGDRNVKGATFKKLTTLRIDTWDPTDKRQCPKGRVDYAAIRQHLSELMPRFPGLIELQIDVSVAVSDAEALYDWSRAQPWGGKVKPYTGNELESVLMWDQLEIRALSGKDLLEIPPHPKLLDELRRARIKRNEKGIRKVVDSPDGNRRGGKKRHRDVAMALAGCCLMASRYGLEKGTAARTVAEQLNNSLTLNSRFRPFGAGITSERF